MTGTSPLPNDRWPIRQAMILAMACLLGGIAGGYLLRQWKSPSVAGAAQTERLAPPSSRAVSQPVSAPARMKAIADANAAPLLARLQSDPNNPDLLASLGNLYYDGQLYPIAVDYYTRALKAKPSDTAVRTDLGTAWWYMGNAGSAMEAFNQALAYQPTNPNTLFNRGVVEWQGEKDIPAALADWKKLLAANPGYAGRAQVEQLIAQLQPQVPAGPPAK